MPRARTFLIEDMRNGGDPKKPHGVCEVKLRKGRIVYEGMRLSLAELRRMGREEWRNRCPAQPFSLPARTRASSATSGSTSFSRRSPGRTWAASSIPTLARPFWIPSGRS